MFKHKAKRVQTTNRLERRCYSFATEEERKQAVREKNRRYYAKYKPIAQRKQRMRHAKRKLEASIQKLGLTSLGRNHFILNET